MGIVSGELQTALDIMASSMVAALPSQGGPSQVCKGKCSDGLRTAGCNLVLVVLVVVHVVASLV